MGHGDYSRILVWLHQYTVSSFWHISASAHNEALLLDPHKAYVLLYPHTVALLLSPYRFRELASIHGFFVGYAGAVRLDGTSGREGWDMHKYSASTLSWLLPSKGDKGRISELPESDGQDLIILGMAHSTQAPSHPTLLAIHPRPAGSRPPRMHRSTLRLAFRDRHYVLS
jgi:hypothetical protein